MKERIIVTLTTWSQRIANIPTVLDTIYRQTLPPNLVVLNLAYDETVPSRVQDYIDRHGIEVNRVADTKVFKKLIPTLRKYPDACVISIDDDWLYPEGMIADFMTVHRAFPDFPISGNREVIAGMQCHCGCASLTKASYFGNYLDQIDSDLISNCPSDDFVYSYLCTLAGHPYIRTESYYFTNMKPYCADEGYSNNSGRDIIEKTHEYMRNRFGVVGHIFKLYKIESPHTDLIEDIFKQSIKYFTIAKECETEQRIYSTYSFRLGQAIVRRLRWLKSLAPNKQELNLP